VRGGRQSGPPAPRSVFYYVRFAPTFSFWFFFPLIRSLPPDGDLGDGCLRVLPHLGFLAFFPASLYPFLLFSFSSLPPQGAGPLPPPPPTFLWRESGSNERTLSFFLFFSLKDFTRGHSPLQLTGRVWSSLLCSPLPPCGLLFFPAVPFSAYYAPPTPPGIYLTA